VETQGTVTLAVYRLNLGTGFREFLRELAELSRGVRQADASVIPLPVKPLRDLAAGRKSYTSYRRSVRALLERLAVLQNSSGRVLAGPALVKFGNASFLSVIDAATGQEVARKVVRLNPYCGGYTGRPPVVDVGGLRVCLILLDDILYPEVVRYCTYSGVDVVISLVPPLLDLDPEVLVATSRTRAVENRVHVIIAGGYSEGSTTPTVLVRSDGRPVDLSSEERSEVVYVSIAPSSGRTREDPELRKLYVEIVRELNKRVGQT
jgi:predicted amidohydrolase